MMNYQEMSDFELELLVAKHLLGEGSYSYDAEKSEVYLAGMDGGEFLPNAYFRPINSWADAGPIIQENGISLYHSIGNWEAEIEYSAPVGAFGTDETCSKFISDKNPLRAAMIVFLMMKGGE